MSAVITLSSVRKIQVTFQPFSAEFPNDYEFSVRDMKGNELSVEEVGSDAMKVICNHIEVALAKNIFASAA